MQDGMTGFPFVDAFMRELACTGYTTHCGRECACWFLVRDLCLDWRVGAEYFEHILIDYEPTGTGWLCLADEIYGSSHWVAGFFGLGYYRPDGRAGLGFGKPRIELIIAL
jgi:hypothetical protein